MCSKVAPRAPAGRASGFDRRSRFSGSQKKLSATALSQQSARRAHAADDAVVGPQPLYHGWRTDYRGRSGATDHAAASGAPRPFPIRPWRAGDRCARSSTSRQSGVRTDQDHGETEPALQRPDVGETRSPTVRRAAVRQSAVSVPRRLQNVNRSSPGSGEKADEQRASLHGLSGHVSTARLASCVWRPAISAGPH